MMPSHSKHGVVEPLGAAAHDVRTLPELGAACEERRGTVEVGRKAACALFSDYSNSMQHREASLVEDSFVGFTDEDRSHHGVIDTAATIHVTSKESDLDPGSIRRVRSTINDFHGSGTQCGQVGTLTRRYMDTTGTQLVTVQFKDVHVIPNSTRQLISWPKLAAGNATLHLNQHSSYIEFYTRGDSKVRIPVRHGIMFYIESVPDNIQVQSMHTPNVVQLLESLWSTKHKTKDRISSDEIQPSQSTSINANRDNADTASLNHFLGDRTRERVAWRKVAEHKLGLPYELAHQMFGHLGQRTMRMLPAMHHFTPGIGYYGPQPFCEACNKGTFDKVPTKKQPPRLFDDFGHLATDAAGPYKPPGPWGEVYILVVYDKHTMFPVIYSMRRQLETKDRIKSYLRDFCPNIYPKIRMDNYSDHLLHELEESHNIMITTNIPYHSKQNAHAERAIRTVTTLARILMEQGGAPTVFFCSACIAAGVVQRFTPKASAGYRMPYTLANKKEPNYPLAIQPLYCKCFVKKPPQRFRKNEPQGELAILLGYKNTRGLSAQCHAYFVLNIETWSFQNVAENDIKFDPTIFPFQEMRKKTSYLDSTTYSRVSPDSKPVLGSVIGITQSGDLQIGLQDKADSDVRPFSVQTVSETQLLPMLEAARTRLLKVPAPPPVMDTHGFTTHAERSNAASPATSTQPTPPDPQLHDASPPLPTTWDHTNFHLLPARLYTPQLGQAARSSCPVADNARMHAVGDTLLFPSFYWGPEFHHRHKSIGKVCKLEQLAADKGIRKASNNAPITWMVFPITQDYEITWKLQHGLPIMETQSTFWRDSQTCQKYGKILTPAQYTQLLNDKQTFPIAPEVQSTTVGEPGGERVHRRDAFSLMSDLDSMLPEYHLNPAHVECPHFHNFGPVVNSLEACIDHNGELTNYGLQRAEVMSIESFLGSLSSEALLQLQHDSGPPSQGVPDPLTDAEAKAHPASKEWYAAALKERNSLMERKVLRQCSPKEVVALTRKGVIFLDTKNVFKTKRGANNEITEYKARCVVRGFKQIEGKHYQADNVVAPTAHAATVRILLAYANQLGWEIDQWDVKNAFMQGDFNEGEELYIILPGSMGGGIYQLLRPLYGIKQAAQNFYNSLERILLDFGFKHSRVDPCLFVFGSQQTAYYNAPADACRRYSPSIQQVV